MEMRLGKTFVCVRWIGEHSFEEIDSVLVVCPLDVVHTWQEELLAERASSTLLLGTAKQKEQLLNDNDTRWYITNYESTFEHGRSFSKSKQPVPTAIANFDWDCVVLDESTRIKNPKAKTTKAANKFLASAPYSAVLSGLPNPEGPLDYFEQMRFGAGEFLKHINFWNFRKAFFHPGWGGFGWVAKAGDALRIKKAVHEQAFCLTRKQAGLKDQKFRTVRHVYLPSSIQKAMSEAEKAFAVGDNETKWAVVTRSWLAQLAGGSFKGYEHDVKCKEVLSLLKGDLKGQQVLIWFKFNEELYHLADYLKAKKFDVDTITGKDKPVDRARKRRRFQKSKYQILLMQIKCGKMGQDYSAASTEIFYSNPEGFEERAQCEDRAVHPLKKGGTLIIDILAKDTIDEDIHEALINKKANAKFFSSKVAAAMAKRLNLKKGA